MCSYVLTMATLVTRPPAVISRPLEMLVTLSARF